MDKLTKQKVFTAIRESFKQSDRYKSELSKALSSSTGPRGGKLYDCNICKKPFKASEIELNHIEPVTEYDKRWYDYDVDTYYSRVFNMPVECVCKSCHKKITATQKKLRK